jgi:hypothetical protein
MHIRIKKLLPSSAFHVKIDAEEDITLQESQSKDSNNLSKNTSSFTEEDIICNAVSILNTTELNYRIEEMFRTEKDFLLILSPYLKITKKLSTILSMSEANIVIIYREEEDENKINESIKNLPNIIPYKVPDFHSKAYISQTHTIITSLNLTEHSQLKNFELGILIENKKAGKLLSRLKEEILYLLKMYGHDASFLDNFNNQNEKKDVIPSTPDNSIKSYTYKILYYALLKKFGINRNNVDTTYFCNLTSFISNELKTKFPYSIDYLQKNDKIFRFPTLITKEMYDYGINSINLQNLKSNTGEFS